MTEAEWLAGAHFEDMLAYALGEPVAERPGFLGWLGIGKQASNPPPFAVSKRKLLLFACAFCRRIESLFQDERSRQAVEVSERYADGLATELELRAATEGASAALFEVPGEPLTAPMGVSLRAELAVVRVWAWAARAAYLTARGEIKAATQMVWKAALEVATGQSDPQWARQAAGDPVRAALLIEIFGNPFRPVTCEPSWKEGKVAQLAEAIYTERAFERMPILADALEESGCTNEEVLVHCRDGGEHVRGCWAVDLITGRK